MKALIHGLLAIVICVLAAPAAAYEPGSVAWVCRKNDKFMFVMGPDSWTACPVRILSRSGNSHRILAHERSCLYPGGSLGRGQEAWIEGYNLWSSRSACEGQGRQAVRPARPATPPPSAGYYAIQGPENLRNIGRGWPERQFVARNICRKDVYVLLTYRMPGNNWFTRRYSVRVGATIGFLHDDQPLISDNRVFGINVEYQDGSGNVVSGEEPRSFNGRTLYTRDITFPPNQPVRIEFCSGSG